MASVFPSRFVEFFGPSLWRAMHSIAFTYPENASPEVRMQYIDFFRSLGPVIPCPSCGKHYMEYMEKHPIEADGKESLARWVYDLHEDVNRRSHKQGMTWEQVKDDYTGWTPEKNSKHDRKTLLQKLGDPHHGRAAQESRSATENELGNEATTSTNRALLIIGIAFLILYMVRSIQKRKQQQEQN